MDDFVPVKMVNRIKCLEKYFCAELLTLFLLQIVYHTAVSRILHQQKYMKLVIKMTIGFYHVWMIGHVTDFQLSDKLIHHLVLLNS